MAELILVSSGRCELRPESPCSMYATASLLRGLARAAEFEVNAASAFLEAEAEQP